LPVLASSPESEAARDADPVLVEVRRGPIVESRHRGAAAVMDASGQVIAAWGDVEKPVYPRSAIKPLQALALVETGAAERYGLGDAELALACASHSGEPMHVARIAAWLERIGLEVGDLECGVHPPMDAASAAALIRAGAAPTPAHNNCSGKHTGMLTAARHRGERTRGYIMADHPVQQRWMGIVGEMCSADLAHAPIAIDGCSIPTVAIPIAALARGMAKLADPSGLAASRAASCERIRRAIAAYPELVAGTGRFCTAVMTAVKDRILLKGGAEGVYCAAVPALGLGVALKIDDGAGRGAEVAIAAILRHVGALSDADEGALAATLAPTLSNWNGLTVGEVRPAPGWSR